MSYGKTATTLELRQNNNNLSRQRRHRVDSFQRAARGHHVITLLAVAFHVNPLVLVPVFHHHHQPGPSFRQIVRRHAFAALVPLPPSQRQRDYGVRQDAVGRGQLLGQKFLGTVDG